jgi:hypothetical protein
MPASVSFGQLIKQSLDAGDQGYLYGWNDETLSGIRAYAQERAGLSLVASFRRPQGKIQPQSSAKNWTWFPATLAHVWPLGLVA